MAATWLWRIPDRGLIIVLISYNSRLAFTPMMRKLTLYEAQQCPRTSSWDALVNSKKKNWLLTGAATEKVCSAFSTEGSGVLNIPTCLHAVLIQL